MIRYKEQGGSLNKLHPRRPIPRQQFPACSRLPCLPGIGSVFPKQRSSHRVQPGRTRLGVRWQLHRRKAQDWENYRYPCLVTNNCRLQTARGVGHAHAFPQSHREHAPPPWRCVGVHGRTGSTAIGSCSERRRKSQPPLPLPSLKQMPRSIRPNRIRNVDLLSTFVAGKFLFQPVV